MATFKVEDGSGFTDSNSYVTVAFADDYHSCRNETEWMQATLEEKQVALIKATDYLDQHFEFVFEKQSYQQALKFPRVDIEGIPQEIKKAVNIYSLFALRGQLYLQQREQIISGEVRKQRNTNKVGSVERTTETEFVGSGTITEVKTDNRFSAIPYLIREFIIQQHSEDNAPGGGTDTDGVSRASLSSSSLNFDRG